MSSDVELVEQADLMLKSRERGVGVLRGSAFRAKAVEFSVVEGRAVFEGDIDLGNPADLVKDLEELSASGDEMRAVGVADRNRLWPNAVVPYEAPSPELAPLVAGAIREIEAKTKIRFRRRVDEDDYIAFQAADYSSSPVGRVGGAQRIRLRADAGIGTAVHELCHSIGLWHEQSREDRDQFIRIQWENIRDGYEHNFRQRITDGDDIGPYDYDSVMHYPSNAFSANGKPTIVPLIGSPEIGQRRGLSTFDAAAIDQLYGDTPSPPTNIEPAPPVVVEGATLQFEVTVGAESTITVQTRGWPVHRGVSWHLIPASLSADGTQLTWRSSVGRRPDGTLSYYFDITNLTPAPLRVQAWYRGW